MRSDSLFTELLSLITLLVSDCEHTDPACHLLSCPNLLEHRSGMRTSVAQPYAVCIVMWT